MEFLQDWLSGSLRIFNDRPINPSFSNSIYNPIGGPTPVKIVASNDKLSAAVEIIGYPERNRTVSFLNWLTERTWEKIPDTGGLNWHFRKREVHGHFFVDNMLLESSLPEREVYLSETWKKYWYSPNRKSFKGFQLNHLWRSARSNHRRNWEDKKCGRTMLSKNCT